MIALCREHHIQADNGAFTIEQLRSFKESGKGNASQVVGKFNWMRNRILAVIGGGFYFETAVVLQIREIPIIWFNRDPKDYLLLNFTLLGNSGEQRAYMRDNEWFNVGGEEDIECPPSARSLKIEYPTGERMRIEFYEIDGAREFARRIPKAEGFLGDITLPITAVEISYRVPGLNIDLSPKGTVLPGITIGAVFASHCGVGLALG
ncbi:hypothetical protein [Aeoliella straminimaris]|nr:hypothetical protein [Aeoliella straminimaris]